MGEALMFRAGGGDSGGSYNLVTEIFNANTSYSIPYGIKDKQICVTCVGGGGGGASYTRQQVSTTYLAGWAGGGGGWVNRKLINVEEGSVVSITIGKGGTSKNSGGSTSFGSYLSASGGGGCYINNGLHGGDGGAGGGVASTARNYNPAYGGKGYQFGGGGAACISEYGSVYSNKGIGGSNGGNGGYIKKVTYGSGTESANAVNGINTISVIQESDVYNSDLIGYGAAGTNNAAGGGGYGANGGNGYSCGMVEPLYGSGGGGGYGKAGYGGEAYVIPGDGTSVIQESIYCGGGGSYGHGAGYDVANNKAYSATYGGGGSSFGNLNGASGLVILQYYKKG